MAYMPEERKAAQLRAQAAYRLNHKERIAAAGKRWRAKERRRVADYEKAFRKRHPEKIKERKAQSRRKNLSEARTKDREYNLRQYGLTLATYESLRVSQGGVCAICFQESARALAVDHCRLTGVVRGLLCGPCNRGLGMFRDNPIRLQHAIKYLCTHG